jgi:proprotein convertase subtilisin/kexin type 5
MTLYGQYNFTPTTNYFTLYINSNADLLKTQLGPYPNWGIKDMVITTLKCDATCYTCTGPASTDCTVCSDSTRTLVNGVCTCDTSRGYHSQGGTCTQTCNGGYYGDTPSANCVLPVNCTAPYRFADPTTGLCVQNCPTNYYGEINNKICTTNCGTYG